MNCLVFWILLSCVAVTVTETTVRFKSAKNYERSFHDAQGGVCELSSPSARSGRRNNAREVICPIRWVLNDTISTKRMVVPYKRKCRHYTKTYRHLCYGSEEGRNGSATCVRITSAYMITESCSDTWLAWENCDKSCGGGFTKRVKFSLDKIQYSKTVEYRPCNTQECAIWGAWRPQLSGNDTAQCNRTTCTRMWERDCLLNGLISPSKLCEYEGYSGSNESERSCSPDECLDATTTEEALTTMLSSYYVAPRTSPVVSRTTDESSSLFHMDVISADGSKHSDDIWLGFAIGFIVSLVFCVVALVAWRQWHQRKEGTDSRKWDSTRTNSSREASLTPFRIERIPRSINEEDLLYSTVQNQTSRNENVYSLESESVDPNQLLVNNQDSSEAADRNSPDPLYSAIPAYECDMADCYPSSEFDSNDDDSVSDGRSCRLPSSEIEKDDSELYPAMITYSDDRAEEGCKSFDSDEGRDIVHTLRKPSTRNKRSPPNSYGYGDVFLSDEEVCKEEHDTERKFAFSRRYSKILTQKAKKTLPRGRNEPVDAGFTWVGGRRWTASTNSDCSSKSTPQFCDWEIGNGQGLSRQHSSLGTCSTASINFDGATSGYNSAIGDSTDDERSLWAKRRMTCSQTSPRNLDIRRKDSTRRQYTRSFGRNFVYATEKRNHFGGVQPMPQNSVHDELCARSNSSHNTSSINHHQRVGGFYTMRPSSQRSLSLISRQGRLIPVEDIYSFPIDAESQNIEKSQHWEYDLPVDALKRKSMKT